MPNIAVPAAGSGLPDAISVQRSVEYAALTMPDGSVDVLSIHRLLAMTQTACSDLRVKIIAFAAGDPHGVDAQCLSCGGKVHVGYARAKGVLRPLFAHGSGQRAPGCAYQAEAGQDIEALRAAQYDGRQESPEHRFWCQAVATMNARDPACREVRVDSYRRSIETEGGRYPDVHAVYAPPLGEFAFEVQMARTWLVEIAGRAHSYGRDGVHLIWVIPNFYPAAPVPAHVRDIASLHRGNVFAVDDHAMEASAREGRMMLTVHVGHRDGTFDPPRLVSLRNLTYPAHGLPYFQDLDTPETLAAWEARRAPWVGYFQKNIGVADALFRDTPERAALLAAFHAAEPGPAGVGDDLLIDIAAILLSVLAEARGGRRVYVTKLANAKAMMNTLLGHRPHVARCADLFETMLERSCLHDWRHGTVGRHLERARTLAGETQAITEDVEGRLFRYLIPEIFDGAERARLAGRDALPDWARPGQTAAQVETGGRHAG